MPSVTVRRMDWAEAVGWGDRGQPPQEPPSPLAAVAAELGVPVAGAVPVAVQAPGQPWSVLQAEPERERPGAGERPTTMTPGALPPEIGLIA
jgi:hypothetical protein